VFVLHRSWQTLVALMTKDHSFVQIELHKVEVQVLNAVLFQKILMP
jgi:hypothetical protein